MKSEPSSIPVFPVRKPLRVCMLAYSFYESDTRIMQYASALAERGDAVEVVALGRPGQDKDGVLDGVTIFRVQERTKNERSALSYLWRIIRFLFVSFMFIAKRHFEEPYDAVHVHSVPDFLVFAALIPKMQGAPVILDIHDILPEFYEGKFGTKRESLLFRSLVLAEQLSVRFADHVIVANHLWHERVTTRSAGPDKCSVVCNYPDPKIFRRRQQSHAADRFLITYPGTLNWHQGVDVAINAFAKIQEIVPRAEFHIYGEGPEKDSLVALTNRLGLNDRIVFHDFLPTDEIAMIMARTDLAVVPKRASSPFGNEAMSTKVMEFMAVGVPLLVSRTLVDSFYHDESRVRFFESENVDELAANILLLEETPSLREELVSNGFKYVEQNNWEIEKVNYLKLIDSLVSVPDTPKELPGEGNQQSSSFDNLHEVNAAPGRAVPSNGKRQDPARGRRVWIDLDNSPHVPFFLPIIEDLEKRGYSVLLTARHVAQVDELMDFHHLKAKRVGRSYGKRIVVKALGTIVRAGFLLPIALKEKPLFAVSHGSRAQLIVASILRLPCIVMTDYEFANQSMVGMSSSWALVPEVIPANTLHMAQERVFHYPGIKEDVYVPRFRPDMGLRQQLGLAEDEIVVTVRPPASEAHYHNIEGDELFREVIEFVRVQPKTRIVVLPRNQKQATLISDNWPALLATRQMLIPSSVVDGLNLIWNSDLVISGGGTMNREAAALGVPVYSIFRGKIGAVDRYLVDQGKLVLIENGRDLKSKIKLVPRSRSVSLSQQPAPALSRIVDQIDAIARSLSPSAV